MNIETTLNGRTLVKLHPTKTSLLKELKANNYSQFAVFEQDDGWMLSRPLDPSEYEEHGIIVKPLDDEGPDIA